LATRRNYATGGTPQFWRNRAFAGTRLAALADLSALWHGTLGPPSGPLGWPGTGLPFAVTTAHPLPHVIGAAYSAPNTMPHEAMIAGYFGSVLKDHYFALPTSSPCPHPRRDHQGGDLRHDDARRPAGSPRGRGARGRPDRRFGRLLVVMSAEGRYAIPTLRRTLKGDIWSI